MTTALRRGELSTAPAVSSNTGLVRRGGRRHRLPVPWPLIVLFVAFPLWWVLGLSALIWSVLAAPMLIGLIWQQRTKAPAAIILWLVFTLWVVMCGLQLESGTKIVTFTYRLTLYACAGILFLYVYNLPRSRRVDASVLRIMTIFWVIVVLGGYLGILVGSHTFTPALDYVLPHSLRGQAFVQELVQPVFADVVKFLGYPVPRPAAPFPYTNNWGGNIAVLTPVAFAAIVRARAGRQRQVLIGCLVASLVPMVVSLNRGMFLSLGIGLLYVAIRLAMRGRVTALVALIGLVIVSVVLIALTPLSHLVLSNLSSAHGNSNTTRLSVVAQSIQGANHSPLFGYGEPQAVTGQGGTPPIGSQGQLWMLLYSDGYFATALFVGFFLVALWQTRRATGIVGLCLHVVPLIALVQIFFYGWLPVELQVVMVITALAYRRCWTSSRPQVGANHPASRRVPVRSAPHRGRSIFMRARHPPVWRPVDRRGPSAGSVALVADRTLSGQAAGSDFGLSAASKIVVRGSLVNLVAMVTGAAMSFGLVVLVSRWLHPRGAGVFFELIALFTILSNTFELGADTGLTRWISRARVVGGLSDVRRIVIAALMPVALVGTGAAVALWIEAPAVAHLFVHGIPSAAGATDIRFIAPLIPLSALSACIVDGVRGFGRMWPYLAIEGIGKPGRAHRRSGGCAHARTRPPHRRHRLGPANHCRPCAGLHHLRSRPTTGVAKRSTGSVRASPGRQARTSPARGQSTSSE